MIHSCKESPKQKSTEKVYNLESRFHHFLKYDIDSTSFPRSYNQIEKQVKKVPSKDWTSGFFAGNLWQIYEITQDTAYKNKAKVWTAFIEKEKLNDNTHDMGFKVYCSFGNGLKHFDNEKYKSIIVKSANTLITRYNDDVKSLRSWDFNKKTWQFPVIIDNMMNLELLFEASKLSGDSIYHKIAVTHANTTLKNHFRSDNSSWHVLDYDSLSGDVRMKVTHQGHDDNSVWSRGQAWAIYGYTMAYRYTEDKKYLNQAQATAEFFLNHPQLPKNGIPYWDLSDPKIPEAPLDVSASTIIASAFTELYDYTNETKYLDYSKSLVETLKTDKFLLNADFEKPFILDHSTGNWPKNDEIDGPIVYADYYFLETLLRLKNK